MWLILFPTPLSLDISFPAAYIFFIQSFALTFFIQQASTQAVSRAQPR